MRSYARALLALFALGTPVLAQSVRVVDKSDAGAFTDIASALSGAAPGDVVLVKSGTYDGFFVAQSVAILADDGADVRVVSPIRIQFLAPGSEVVISGLTVEGLGPNEVPITVSASSSYILFQDLEVIASEPFFGPQPSMTIAGSSSVVLVDSRIDGVDAYSQPAVTIGSSASVWMYGSRVSGSFGLNSDGDFFDGGNAVEISSGELVVVDCNITGGWTIGDPPGHGVHLMAPPSNLDPPTLIDYGSAIAGGMMLNGTVAAPVQVDAGTSTSVTADLRSFLVDATARVGETFTMQFTGEAHDLLWLVVDVEANDATPYLPDLFGTLHPGPTPPVIKKLADLDASGQRTLNVTLNPLGVPGIATLMQAVMFGAADGFVVSNPRFVALLDAIP